ncbi:amino acid ABC transporter substrate-binding protein [Bacillus sp. BRMEA1]|uniref:amino acid ABC transporter substrate-binding protein n=1 Tax=Neobacillus endophyticus TaxID=2738405 RepID=UPI001565608B|nr:amino acid ABC transporter substrate-binding protein [Neobacillus endophyticus]NRD76443.1 amino acid ABC transporter substrate-binding protein [Neobacillus endophyticus]
MKKLSVIFTLVLSFMFLLSACGTADNNKTGDNTKKSDSSQTAGGDLLKQVKDAGVLTIGTEGTYSPFTFHDNSGKLTGFDVEIAQEVAKRLGVKAEFKETQWDAMFAGLDAKRFDMIANEVGINPDRQKKYDFSSSYITSEAVVITAKNNNKVKSFNDIKGLNSAQSLTSNYADLAKKYGAKIVGVDGFEQAIELLSQKRVDVTVNDKIAFLDYTKQKPNAPVKIAATSADASQSAFMFRKGSNTLVDAVNKALKDMIADGTYKKISEKWFGQDVLK